MNHTFRLNFFQKYAGLATLLILGLVQTLGADTTASPPLLLKNPASLQTLKEKLNQDPAVTQAYQALCRQADRDLTQGPFSVMDKTTTPASGDKHDYTTLARYWWKENGQIVRKDGRMNPETETNAYDKSEWEHFESAVQNLAFAYALSGRADYGQRAALLLQTWFLDSKTRMNPNLNFAQCRYGTEGTSYGIIETAHLPEVLDAATLLRGCPEWTAADQAGIKKWASDYLNWLTTSPLGIEEGRAKNNHGTWYDVQVAALELYTGDPGSAKKLLSDHTVELMASQIAANGSQPLELKRTKSFSYSVYNLQAFVAAAFLSEKVGLDMWNAQSPNGASLQKALDFLLPYAAHPEKWPYQQIEPINRKELAWFLRIASKKYKDTRYQQALESIPSGEIRNGDLLNFP